MPTDPLISPDRLALVRAAKNGHWIQLGLRLTQEFTGGDLVRLADGAMFSVEGTDELSSSYTRSNWTSGITSRALYAFRTLRLARQCLVLTEVSGRLGAADMEAVANSSTIAIAKLADKALPQLPTEGWDIQTEIVEQAQRAAPAAGALATAAREQHGANNHAGSADEPSVESPAAANGPQGH